MNRTAIIFSIITIVGIHLAIVSGAAWIVTARHQRNISAKRPCIGGLIVTAVAFALFLRSYDSSLHQESPEPQTQEDSPKQPQEPVQEPTSDPVDVRPRVC